MLGRDPMTAIKTWRQLALPTACALATLLSPLASVARGQSILDTWTSVTTPPPPQLNPVIVDAKHAALLLLDFSVATCTETKRPSCVRSIPRVARLLADARAHHMLVVYSTGGNVSPEVPTPLVATSDEPSVRSGVDKFMGTDLEKILSAAGVQTVIVTGTSAHGAVLYTASGAALRNLTVIVPVDGYSADSPFAELYTAWHLKNAPASVSAHVTLTKTDLITIH
jgi:nicotinamidase-related amidase